jgi:hypothetical protein
MSVSTLPRNKLRALKISSVLDYYHVVDTTTSEEIKKHRQAHTRRGKIMSRPTLPYSLKSY